MVLVLFITEIRYKYVSKYFNLLSHYVLFLPALEPSNTIQEGQVQLYNHGVASGLGVISKSQCDLVKSQVIEYQKSAPEDAYKSINTNYRRSDLFVPLEGPVLDTVKQLLYNWKSIQSPLYHPQSKIVEVACFISLPGCEGQTIHSDTNDEIQHKDAISFGVFLQDVDKKLSPLAVESNASSHSWHGVTGKKGDVYGWSAKVQHGGGANRAIKPRYLFYITIVYPPLQDIDVGEYSLLKQYGNGIMVKDIV
tara:strand:+ start:5194 stop:5946 length:753 start_codon:yes stop_codon:yes gene_type:complete